MPHTPGIALHSAQAVTAKPQVAPDASNVKHASFARLAVAQMWLHAQLELIVCQAHTYAPQGNLWLG